MKILLSSAATFPFLKETFKQASNIGADGVEIHPYRWTRRATIAKWSNKYDVPVMGIHFSFFSHKLGVIGAVKREADAIEKFVYQPLWFALYGTATTNGNAHRVAQEHKEAYLLFHPDVFMDLRGSIRREYFGFLSSRVAVLENERYKIDQDEIMHDPSKLREYLQKENHTNIDMMFDPRHIQLSTQQGALEEKPLHEWYLQAKPKGMHFGFASDNGIGLPDDKTWSELTAVIKEHPLEYIVIEVTPPGVVGMLKRNYSVIEKAMDFINKLA